MADISNSAMSKMAGNGMHLASAGFCCLMAMLCVTDKAPVLRLE